MVYSPFIKSMTLVLLSFVAGLFLMFIQLPPRFEWLQPQWLVLILFCLALTKPLYVNVGIAWFIGIFLDVMYNVPIGENALALVLMTYLLIKFRQKTLQLGLLGSSLVIFVLIMSYQLLILVMQKYFGGYFNVWSILGSALTSALIWPILAFILFNFQKRLRI